MKPALAACMSSARCDWATPAWLVEKVRTFFGGSIGLDPCSDGSDIAERRYSAEDNGLLRDWCAATVYVNPPYGRKHNEIWAQKIVREVGSNARELIALTTARPDTKWFRLLAEHCACICFVGGRIVFEGAKHGAPFPSALWYFGHRHEEFRRDFADIGLVMFEVG